jgi:hypothetical protein
MRQRTCQLAPNKGKMTLARAEGQNVRRGALWPAGQIRNPQVGSDRARRDYDPIPTRGFEHQAASALIQARMTTRQELAHSGATWRARKSSPSCRLEPMKSAFFRISQS